MLDATLVTVHGFWSSPATWDRLGAVWQADDELAGLRLHGFGYPTPKKPLAPFSPTRIPDFDDIAQMLAVEYTTVLGKESNIAFVTHSQGGLILQRFLAWMVSEGRGRELARIRTIVMLACPNGGSQYLASIRRASGYGHHPQAADLEVLSKQVSNTQRAVLARIVHASGTDDSQCRIPFHVYAAGFDAIVPAASAQSAFPGAGTLAGNHTSILDPLAPGNRTANIVKYHILTDLTDLTERPPGRAQVAGATVCDSPAEHDGPGVALSATPGAQVGDHNVQYNFFTGQPTAEPRNQQTISSGTSSVARPREPSADAAEPEHPRAWTPTPNEPPAPAGNWIPEKGEVVIESADGAPACVTFSGDGRMLAWGAKTAARIMDTMTQRRTHRFRTCGKVSLGAYVNGLAFSPDGRLLAGACEDACVRVWETADGTVVHSEGMRPGTSSRYSAAFLYGAAWTPDGALLAAGGYMAFGLWRTATWEAQRSGPTMRDHALGVAFSSDGQLYAVASGHSVMSLGGGGGQVSVWRTADGSAVREFHGKFPGQAFGLISGATGVAFSPDGRLLAASGRATFSGWPFAARPGVWVWDIDSGEQAAVLDNVPGFALSVAFSPDGTLLAAGCADGTVRVWETATGTLATVLRGHDGRVKSLAFSPTEQILASCGADKTIRFWR